MAYESAMADALREDLEGVAEIDERRMFGGLVFMYRGHMLIGARRNGGWLARVGPAGMAEALATEGVTTMVMQGREMNGFVTIEPAAMDDEDLRRRMLQLALDFNATLPAKG